ncbi:MAG: BatD family protein [Cyclobacteriaceae bacterium]|nr:BatD family protein [Cyclobacteriaceae bacterium]
MKFRMRTTFTFVLLWLARFLAAQDNVQITLGPDEIGENQAWTITVTVSNDRLKNYENFPDIDGFKKRGTSTQSQTSIVNGQVSSTQSVIMTYVPTRQGTFSVLPFKMKVNDQIYSVNGKKIKVGPAVQSQPDPFRSFFDRDPVQDFFGRGGETEFVDIKEDALLAVRTSKDEVYVGEGFNVTLSFLVADNNRATMQFHELGPQLTEALKKLRPSNCWEENFNIENIEGEHVEIDKKGYTQYKLYQGTFYPLNNKPVELPSVALKMIKYKIAKNPSFFGQNRQEDFKTFYSKAKVVKVKELPPHPLRDAVSVGEYRLDEKLINTQLQTGQSAAYEFRIFGEGNISAIEKPVIPKSEAFDFYEPNIRQSINRESGRVAGTKTFNYYVVPKEPGTYNLGQYLQWIYFSPSKKKYDTLRSSYTLTVTGESQQNQAIESTDPGLFYDRLNAADNTLKKSNATNWNKLLFNFLIVVMLGVSVYLVIKR